MKQVLQFIPYSFHIHGGGVEKISSTISTYLNQKKDITLLNIASNIDNSGNPTSLSFDDTVFIPSVEILRNFPLPALWKPSFRASIKKIKKSETDIIITHTRFFTQSVMGGILSKLRKKKWIHIEHGSGFVTGYPRYIKLAARIFDYTCGRWIFRQCDQIVTISHAHKSFIQKFTNKNPIVIYNPIDYTPRKRVENPIPHIGYVGRLVPLKGVDILILALRQIENMPRTCTIVGTGSEEKKLQNLALRLGIKDRINFVGYDDRSNRLHRFDIFVNPSYQEGLPTTVVEALIAGCLVIATDVGGTREISNRNLKLFTEGNIQQLSDILEHQITLGKFGTTNINYGGDDFSINSSINKYYIIIKNHK